MVGSGLSIFFLAPTLRDATARVPLGTSLPSMGIGIVYGLTFSTMGMTFSATGALCAGTMWALIALFRSPGSQAAPITRVDGLALFVRDAQRWLEGLVGETSVRDQFVVDGEYAGSAYGNGPVDASIGFDHPHTADD
ncbi:hypothetical protein NGM15_11970 [Natronosalvus halobius]|nr:hypothetical protein [Natronosalvus halobius]USZ70812.1 hypothetical protein NGM15_11970 [Natronosalvus halobius]